MTDRKNEATPDINGAPPDNTVQTKVVSKINPRSSAVRKAHIRARSGEKASSYLREAPIKTASADTERTEASGAAVGGDYGVMETVDTGNTAASSAFNEIEKLLDEYEPLTDEPSTDEPLTDELSAEKPSADKPKVDKPTVEWESAADADEADADEAAYDGETAVTEALPSAEIPSAEIPDEAEISEIPESSDETPSVTAADIPKKTSPEPSAQPRHLKPRAPGEGYYISFENVRKSYKMGDVTINAVNGVNFHIYKEEFAVIVGASGAGKTTVLNLLGGIDRSDEGVITVDGRRVSSMNRLELTKYRRNDIGFVFQFYNLIPNLTARENIELAAQIAKSDIDVDEILDAVGLTERAMNFPAQMSGGEQQRIAIARALAKNPKLLLCDEPTGALDDETGRSILILLHKTCRQRGMTVALITHNSSIRPIADRVISMRSGMVISNEENPEPVPPELIVW